MQTPFFLRKFFSNRLISSGGKMDRMPSTCAMGLALECFQWIIPLKGMIYWKIFPTTRHSIHVWVIVRKATLNEPRPLRIRVVFGIRELLRRFGYFWAPKVTKRKIWCSRIKLVIIKENHFKWRLDDSETLWETHQGDTANKKPFVYFSAKK